MFERPLSFHRYTFDCILGGPSSALALSTFVSQPISAMTASPHRRETLLRLWRSRYAVELVLLIFLWTTYAYFYQSTGTNEAVRFDQIRALVQDHTLAIDTYCYNSPDLVRYPDPGGKLYPNKSPGLTLLGVVPWAVLSSVLTPLRAVGLPEWVYWHLLTYFTIVLSVSLVSALGA